jgi:hypothetical protein
MSIRFTPGNRSCALILGAREISFRGAALPSNFWVNPLFGKVPLYASLPFIAAAVTIPLPVSLLKIETTGTTDIQEQRSGT